MFTDGGRRADAGALTTAGATSRVDIARLIDELGYKAPRLAFKSFQFGIGNDVYVVMPADLDQFG